MPRESLPPLPGARCPLGKGTSPRSHGTCAGGGGVPRNHGGCGGFYDNGDNFDGDVSVGPTQDLHQPLLLELRQPPLQRQPVTLLRLRGRRAGRPRGAQLLLHGDSPGGSQVSLRAPQTPSLPSAHPQRLQLPPRLAQLLLQLRYLGHGVVLRILQLLCQLWGTRRRRSAQPRPRPIPPSGLASAALPTHPGPPG